MKYLILFIFITSCTTQKRCYDKFPPKMLSSNTTFVNFDTTIYKNVTLPPLNFGSDWIALNVFEKDTVIKIDTFQNVIYLTSKSGNIKVDCKTDSIRIKDLEIELELSKETITNQNQVFFDQRAELKKIRSENRAIKASSRMGKWGAIKDITKYILLSILFLGALNYYKK